jgi:hypothetical protein
MPKFQKGVSGNPKGRPPLGLSFADKVRAVVGGDGQKLVDMWAAAAFGHQPTDDGTSSRALYLTALHTLQRTATIGDRIQCSKLLADRGFGQAKELVEHSGEISALTRVVHEYHSS